MPENRPFIYYAAERSYYSGKARPAFRIKRVFMEERLPTPANRSLLLERTGHAFLPTVITPEDEVWQDTSDILDRLENRVPDPPLFPASPVQRIVAYLLELYADEFMLMPGLHYRWAFPDSADHAARSFAAASGVAAAAKEFADTIANQFAPVVGATAETAPLLEAHVADLLALLEKKFAESRFLLGDAPSLADCSLMGPMYGHFFLDPEPGRLLRAEAPQVCHWIETMNHPNQDDFGEWLPGDALSTQMRLLLELIGADAIPLLLDTATAFDEWADQHAEPGATPPRVVGMHTTSLRGLTFERYTSPYAVWMIQRPRDAYQALGDDERHRVDEALQGTGCEALFQKTSRHRLEKSGIELVFSADQNADGSAQRA